MESPTCAPTVKLIWDQWVVTVVECSHGKYSAPSRNQDDALKSVRDAWIKYLVAHGAYGEYLADRVTPEDHL